MQEAVDDWVYAAVAHRQPVHGRVYQDVEVFLRYARVVGVDHRPHLLNILRQTHDYLTIMPKLRSTCDERLIYKTSYEERKTFLRYNSRA